MTKMTLKTDGDTQVIVTRRFSAPVGLKVGRVPGRAAEDLDGPAQSHGGGFEQGAEVVDVRRRRGLAPGVSGSGWA
jgi:hypothetical protein